MRSLARCLLSAAALFSLLDGRAVPPGAQYQEGDCRALAGMLLPNPSTLGPGWVRPWEIPVAIPSQDPATAVSTEAAYWSAVEKRLSAVFSLQAPSASQLLELRTLGRPPAVTLPENLRESAARMRSMADALRRAPGRTPEEKALSAQEVEADATAPSFAGLNEAGIAAECRRLAAPVRGYSLMTYLHAADWNAVARAQDPSDLAAALDWMAIRIQRLDPSAQGGSADLKPEDAGRLQDEIQNLLDRMLVAARDQRAALGDSTQAPPLRAALWLLDQGDHSYMIQCGSAESGGSAVLPNLTAAWMRRGELRVEVSLTGPMSPVAGDALVQSVLLAVDRAVPRSGPVRKAEEKTATGMTEFPGPTVSALGLRMGFRAGVLQVASVESGSWAEKTKIISGWVILRINEEPIAGLTLDQIRERLLRADRPFIVIDFILPGGEAQRMLLPARR